MKSQLSKKKQKYKKNGVVPLTLKSSSIYPLLITVILIGALSIFVGLILIQMNTDSKERIEEKQNLKTLYLDVKSIADDIKKNYPHDIVLNKFAPYLETILENIEKSELSGVETALSYSKNFLSKLEEKLAESQKTKKKVDILNIYDMLLRDKPKDVYAMFGRAKVVHELSQEEESNSHLEEAIKAYINIIKHAKLFPEEVPTEILWETCFNVIDRLTVIGWYGDGLVILKHITKLFPDDLFFKNLLGKFHLLKKDFEEARRIFTEVLEVSPSDGFALTHLGYIIKLDAVAVEELREAISYMEKGIRTEDKGTQSKYFFYHLGDAYERLGQADKAYEIYDLGVSKGLFLSRYQRSLINVDRLKAKPVWTLEETTYEPFFRKLEAHFEEILEEGVKAMNLHYDPNSNLVFRDQGQNLHVNGDWTMFDFFINGKKNDTNCKLFPVTCGIIQDFPPAAKCRRGQSKFSLMEPGTHLIAHVGPTNCRLRSHLGLVLAEGTSMRVANQTLQWERGKILVFDDSFDHEVWHNGTKSRLILIVDVWHPELTEEERNTLTSV